MSEPLTNDELALVRLKKWMPKDWLIRCHHVCRNMRRYRGMPLWSFIADITAHGSGYSIAICQHFGWDPHAPASRKLT